MFHRPAATKIEDCGPETGDRRLGTGDWGPETVDRLPTQIVNVPAMNADVLVNPILS